jgi:hypothetical protein
MDGECRCLLHAGLRRAPQEKALGAPAVSVHEDLKHGPPADSQVPAQRQKISGYFLAGRAAMGRSDIRQRVPLPQYSMSTAQSKHNHCQPTGNQPWGYETIRIHRYRGAMKTLLSHLPVLQHQEQGPYHSIHGVLEVGNQLGRQYRKGPLALIAEKTSNRNGLFLELWE